MKTQAEGARLHVIEDKKRPISQIGCESCLFCDWCRHCAPTTTRLAGKQLAGNRLFFEKGASVAHEGNARDGVLVVLSGVLKLFKSLPDGRTQILGFRYAGDLVTSRRCDMAWHLTVQVVTRAALCRIDCDSIRLARKTYPEMDHLLLELAREEVSCAHEHMLALGRKTPLERLASFLLEIEQKQNKHEGPSGKFGLPMTRYDIADYLGLENETVSRIFTRLKSMGTLSLPQPNVVILHDRKAMQCLADGTNNRSMTGLN